MTSTEINNEIVLLRRYVRQARVCVIKKLIRKGKRLRTNCDDGDHGEKKKNKSEKYLKEVFALKGVKDDEISKFGIIHFDKLHSILQNPQTDDKTRAIVKVIGYKSFHPKIKEFVKKFPHCSDFISTIRKNRLSEKTKGNNVNRLREKTSNQLAKEKRKVIKSSAVKNNADDIPKKDESPESIHSNVQTIRLQDDNNDNKNIRPEGKLVNKIVSKEALVERFADILRESNATRIEEKEEDGGGGGGDDDGSDLNDDNDNEFEKSKERSFNNAKPMTVPSSDDFFLNADRVAPSVDVSNIFRNKDLNIAPSQSEKISKTRKEKLVERKPYPPRQKVNRGEKFANEEKRKSRNEKVDELTATKNETLHPSWVAKKKLQDMMKQGFKGKKIRFEEE